MDSRLDPTGGHTEHHSGSAGHQRRLAQAVMRRQLSLSIKIAAVFLIILMGLPLVNYFMPGMANLPVFGFTVTWLFLAVLFYPVTWILSWVFIRQSNVIEADIAATMRRNTMDETLNGTSSLASGPEEDRL